MDILVCLTDTLPFCSCSPFIAFILSPHHLCIFKVCHVSIGRKSPRERLIYLLKFHFFRYKSLFVDELDPNFLS